MGRMVWAQWNEPDGLRWVGKARRQETIDRRLSQDESRQTKSREVWEKNEVQTGRRPRVWRRRRNREMNHDAKRPKKTRKILSIMMKKCNKKKEE